MLEPNKHIIQDVISAIQYKVASTTSGYESNENYYQRTELYLNANMVVLGMNALISQSIGRTCSVKPLLS